MNAIDYPQLLESLHQNTAEAEANFGSLNVAQLNFRPGEKKWSISQCLHHIVLTNSAYFPELKRAAVAGFKMRFWEKHSPFSTSIGKSMVAQLGSNGTKNFHAPRIFQPVQRKASGSGVIDFIAHQKELEALIKALQENAPERCVLTSPVSKLITIPLNAVLNMLVEHEKRHLLQANRLTQHSNFPK